MAKRNFFENVCFSADFVLGEKKKKTEKNRRRMFLRLLFVVYAYAHGSEN